MSADTRQSDPAGISAGEPEIELVLFRGFGGHRRVCVAGRVIRPSHLVPVRDNTSWRTRLRDAWRLLVSRRVPQAEIELHCGDEVWHTRSDGHGYFFSCRKVAPHSGEDLWSHYQARLVDHGAIPVVATGQILNVSREADQLVISDIDDTVVHSGVANKLKMLWRMYVIRSAGRMPFPGMAAFLRGLHDGASGHANNPMIYVSRSPWSLYPTLDEFFNRNAIPIGPVLLLRDWGITLRHPFPRRAEDHKASMIDQVIDSIPELPVILIGDSGQHDPETYAAAVDRHGDRVQGIFIRNLEHSARRSRELAALAAHLEGRGVHLMASSDADTMAAYAIRQGWMPAATQSAVHHQVELDEV